MPKPAPTSSRPGSPASTPAEPSGPSTSRPMIVGVHVVLIVLAVVVVWATTARDPGTLADASVAGALADPAMTPEAADQDVSAEPWQALAMPMPKAEPAASFTLPATVHETALEPENQPTPVTASPASDTVATTPPAVEPFKPMVALPEADATFPPVMPAAAEDAPHYHHGGLYGTPGATRLVYLVDASGSLVDTFPFILNELQRSLADLKPEQSFAVLFFSGDRVTEAPPYGMKRATNRAVRHTSQWIDPGSGRILASGRPNADAAIRRALAYQPDAVILLSDGLTGQGDQALARRARLLSLIDTANTQDAVFHTLQVRRPDPLASPTRLGTLELIALQSGGVHRYLSEEDLLPANEPATTRGPGVGDRALPLR